MNSQEQQNNNQLDQQIKRFINSFNKHCEKTHPKVFNQTDLLKLVEEHMFDAGQEVTQVQVKQIQQQLTKSLKSAQKNHKNGVLIIGPPGIGKTAFMKYYARRNFKILINANCCNLVGAIKHHSVEVINLLFEMANFSDQAILFFDEIDILMNDQNSFPNQQLIRETLLKNIGNTDYETPIVYSTNKPWKIDDENFLKSIYCSIQIPISSYQKRKALIKMIIKDSASQNLDTSMIDPQDIAKKTLNYLNSDIYVLIRQMIMQPLTQLINSGKPLSQIQNEKMKVSEEHIVSAYNKIRPSILVEQINEYKKWQSKFEKINQ